MQEERTPVLKENEAGVLCVQDVVEALLMSVPRADLARMARLVERIKGYDLPPARPESVVNESAIDPDAVLRFVRGQFRPVTRREIEQALATTAPRSAVVTASFEADARWRA